MAKTDRSVITTNDQQFGDVADPNKLETQIEHAYDTIDTNDDEFITHKGQGVDKTSTDTTKDKHVSNNDIKSVWDALDTKTDLTGDHEGTWQGLTPGEASEEINGARIDKLKSDLLIIAHDVSSFSDAVNEAKTSSKDIFLSAGLYELDGFTIDGLTDCTIFGEKGTVIKTVYGSSAVASIVLTNCDNVRFSNITFKGTIDDNATYPGLMYLGVRITTSSNINFDHCKFIDFTSVGIWANQLNGGTFTEGVRITNCDFFDFLPQTDSNQTAIILGDDGEYSTIDNCKFFRVPQAVRFKDGANSNFTNNIVMQSNGVAGTDRACVYVETNSNYGKILIANNKINHNDDMIPIIINGDDTKPQNPCKIIGNDILVNKVTTLTGSEDLQILLVYAHNTIVLGNNIRSAGGNVSKLIRLTNSDDVIFNANDFQNGKYSIELSNSTMRSSNNNFISYATSKFNVVTGFYIDNDIDQYTGRISSTGVKGSFFPAGWSVSKLSVGEYEVTHNLGHTNYTPNIIIDNLTTPLMLSVVRTSTTFTIYVTDNSGTATDANLLFNVIFADS